jgi:hypothetical protein
MRNKENFIIANVALKKSALTHLCSRTIYKMPSKYRHADDIPVIEFGAALMKIEDVFSEEFQIEQGEGKKVRKTFPEVGFKKLNEFQNSVIGTNAKRWAKREFE